MNLQEIKELLSNPEIKQVIEAEILEAVKEKQAELDSKLKEIEESKKMTQKDTFIAKKALLEKTKLYETKLKDFYEKKFEFAKKKLATEVYDFMNESVKALTENIKEDASRNSKAEQIQEAFSHAVRLMAPHMNINELAAARESVEKTEELKSRVNSLVRENKSLKEKVLSDEIQTLALKETTGYPVDKQVVILETLKQAAPKTLVEASEAIEKIKILLREKEEETSKSLEESSSSTIVEGNEPLSKEQLKELGKVIKDLETPKQQPLSEDRLERPSFIPSYDISLLD